MAKSQDTDELYSSSGLHGLLRQKVQNDPGLMRRLSTTVNSDIFVRILFSRKSVKSHKFATRAYIS